MFFTKNYNINQVYKNRFIGLYKKTIKIKNAMLKNLNDNLRFYI